MSFKFEFDVDFEDESLGTSTAPCPDHKGAITRSIVQLTDCIPVSSFLQAKEIFLDATELQYLTKQVGNDVQQDMEQDHDDKISTRIDSDLIPHVYEGGLKIWDGSLDLLRFISEKGIPFDGKKVLELGCGVGLPGIYALTEGATVHFQDYNEEVLRQLTIPTVLLNSQPSSLSLSSARFFSGDWESVKQLLLDDGIQRESTLKYDVILTSETIYSLESYEKLHDIMRAILKPSGVIYLAAKTFYFGVGGGTREFQTFIREKAVFDAVAMSTIEYDGVYRELLKLSFRPDALSTNEKETIF